MVKLELSGASQRGAVENEGWIASSPHALPVSAWAAVTAIVAGAVDPIIILDNRATVVEWNAAAEAAFEIKRESALGLDFLDLVISETNRDQDRERLSRIFERPLQTAERQMHIDAQRGAGEQFPAEVTVTPIRLGDDWLYSATVRDVSSHELLSTREEHLRAIMHETRVVVWASDRTGRLTLLEGHDDALSSLSAAALVGHRLSAIFADQPHVVEAAERALAGARVEVETQFMDRLWQATFAPLPDARGEITGIAGVSRDITEQRLAEDAAAELAATDAVTGALNRTGLEREVTRLGHSRRLAVLHVGVDRCEMVAASVGRAAGEDFLRIAVARTREALGDRAIVARPDGHELTVLLPDADERTAVEAARELVARLGEAYVVGGERVYADAAVGIAPAVGDDTDATKLVRSAQRAYLRAKEERSGGWVVHAADERDPRERLKLLTELHEAIEGDQFHLVYQPIFRLSTGHPYAVEALIRWNHPLQGPITPGDFLPLAEECGLMSPIGHWVIRELCRQAAEWRDIGVTPQLHFNASPRELCHPDFAVRVLAAIDRYKLPATQFTLEITESAVMDPSERSCAVVKTLRQAGLRIAIDDFGAGHSSLARLRTLPVDALKIDLQFLRSVPADPDATAVLTAILDLASALRIDAIGEGIENDRQLDFLLERGCPFGQGYFITRPTTASAIAAQTQMHLAGTKRAA